MNNKLTIEYKGHSITVDEKGIFFCTVNNVFTKSPSLAACKSKINASITNKFKPFSALEKELWGGRNYLAVEVLGINSFGKMGRRVSHFVIKNRSPRTRLIKNTPENVELLKKIRSHQDKMEKVREEMQKQLDELESRITWIEAEEWKND